MFYKIIASLVPWPSITANVVEGLTSGGRWEVWLIALCMY